MSSMRAILFAAVAVTLASLTGCSSGINTMTGATTATRVTRFSGFAIDDPSPVAPGSHMPPVIGRGYGYMGG